MFLRNVGMFGLGAAFLIISPPLRESLVEQGTLIGAFVQDRGPWSYAALSLAALAAAMLWVHRASRVR